METVDDRVGYLCSIRYGITPSINTPSHQSLYLVKSAVIVWSHVSIMQSAEIWSFGSYWKSDE